MPYFILFLQIKLFSLPNIVAKHCKIHTNICSHDMFLTLKTVLRKQIYLKISSTTFVCVCLSQKSRLLIQLQTVSSYLKQFQFWKSPKILLCIAFLKNWLSKSVVGLKVFKIRMVLCILSCRTPTYRQLVANHHTYPS